MNAPDLLQQDQGNRERALEPRSFIVEAPAGAGKTELLTQRFLRLLALVREPEEIVAITFTNKAAAEMRSRILDSLQRAAAGEQPAQPHKRTTWALAQDVLRRSAELDWALLEQPARLRILTIDALCSHLARQMPLLSRFGSQPGVCEDAAEYYREAARRTLAMLEDEAGDGVVTEALGYLDNDTVRLAGLLADMLARRDQWLSHAGRGTLQQEVEQALGRLVRQDLQQATAQFTPGLQRQLMPAARYAAANLAGDAALAPLADWSEPLPADPVALPQWRSLCELLLTQKDEWRKSVNVKQGFPAVDEAKPYKQLLQEVIAALPDARAFGRIRALPEICHAEAEWRMVNCLARLLQLAAAQLWTVFQEAGVVDFVEVSRRALAALEDQSGPTDLALRLDYRIQHLLVDEFQDTSPAQVRLLEKLTAGWQPDDGRTLFCVGDPMQSIYRFRKAEVGLFLQVAELGIGHLRLERLHLTRNNRSCPAVVEWVNQAFARVFPQHDDASRGAIRYRPFVATRAARDGEGVQVHALLRNDEDGSAEAVAYEARYVAALIAEERRRDPGCSMAVLVRARSHLEALVAEIRRHHPDLSFQAVEIEALGGRQSVQDALTLARAMLHRADRVHWLALLRAPWCGLTLADLHALAGDDHHATLWQLMQDEARLARLSPDGRQRLLHVRDVLAASFAQRGRQPVRRWLESAWLRLGGPQCLVDAGDVRDVAALFDLIERLEAAGRFTPAGLEAAMQELYAAPDSRADGLLQFMTIHKSKGLEFDTVILPGLHRSPRNSDAPLLLWEEVPLQGLEPQLIAAPWVPKHKRNGLPGAYDYLQGLEQQRAANEAARVLYVAATRTERRLHLVGVLGTDSKGEIRPPAGTFLDLLWPSVGGSFMEQAQAAPEAPQGLDESAFVPQLLRLPQPAVPPLLAEASAVSALAAGPLLPAAEAASRLQASCGSLAHAYMEIIAREGAASWPAERLRQVQPAMRRWLERQGLPREEAEQGAARVAQWLTATLQSADGDWVLHPREGAAAELALSSAQGGGIASHVIDRTFVDAGERWVIDYKSSELGDTPAAAALQQEAERHRAQLERYAGLFREEALPLRLAVFFLAHGQLVELRD